MRKHLEGITARGKKGDKVQKLAKTKNFSKHIDFSLFNNSLNLYMKTKEANSAKRFVEVKHSWPKQVLTQVRNADMRPKHL